MPARHTSTWQRGSRSPQSWQVYSWGRRTESVILSVAVFQAKRRISRSTAAKLHHYQTV